MRILITSGIFPPDSGGPATYVPLIANGFAEHGHRVIVITLSDSLDHDDRRYPFEVVRICRCIPSPLRFFVALVKIISEGRKSDILYVNGLGLESAFGNSVLRKPMVQKVVGDRAWERARNREWVKDDFATFQTKRYSLKVELLRRLRTFVTRRADYIIVTTRYFRDVVSEWLREDQKIRIVGNTVVPENYPQKECDISLQTKRKVITVCRLVRWKAIDDLIYAVSYLDNVGLVIVGDGPERDKLERLSDGLGISNRVFFAGQVANEKVPAYLKACDVFILPSTWESFAIVILEAMAAGIPVIVSDIGGPSEFIQHGQNGLLVPPGDRQALSEAMDTIFEDSEIGRKFVVAAQTTLSEFSVENIVEKTLDVLNEAARQSAQGSQAKG